MVRGKEQCVFGKVGGCKAIPPVVARIFSGDRSSPLTREARIQCFLRDSAVLEGYAGRGVVVLLQLLWEWQYQVQREERAPHLRKARGIVRVWEGWCGQGAIPTVTARNSSRIVKAGLSEYCTASRKTSTAVPPPLFRGEARIQCFLRDSAVLQRLRGWRGWWV